MERKTANDYRKEYKNILNNTVALEARIKNRLKELIKRNPNAIIDHSTDDSVPIKANSLNSGYYFDTLTIDTILQYIEIIEKYLADSFPHKQQEIDFK